MKKNKITVNFDINLNKNIYKVIDMKDSYEDFISRTILQCIDKDNFVIREVKKLDEKTQKEYEGLLKTMEHLNDSVMESATFKLLEENENNQYNEILDLNSKKKIKKVM